MRVGISVRAGAGLGTRLLSVAKPASVDPLRLAIPL